MLHAGADQGGQEETRERRDQGTATEEPEVTLEQDGLHRRWMAVQGGNQGETGGNQGTREA
jgi:hypothetical protein